MLPLPAPTMPPASAAGSTVAASPALAPAAVGLPSAQPRAELRPVPPPRDFAARARELIANDLPLLAQRAERRVQRVLELAAGAGDARQDEALRREANAIRSAAGQALPGVVLAPDEAQVLHEAARVAFRRRGGMREALDLQLRAFGANPLDADIAGSLAFLWLKQGPAQADVARQLVLHALTLPDVSRPGSHLEDWTTLAIANGLSGREPDASRAWLMTLALAPQPERQCRAAINAYSLHGERLREGVEALLQRAYGSGLAQVSALCEWPPHWMASRAMR
jgi:hypothetical protein